MTEKRTSSARARSGFTLAELLIVTGIVSILVAVSIPIMSGQVQKAKEVRAKAEARILCMALWMYLHDLDEQDIHPESWELMMDLGGSFRIGEKIRWKTIWMERFLRMCLSTACITAIHWKAMGESCAR